MDFSKVTAITIPEGNVTKIEDSKGKVLWSSTPDPNKYAYGIRWDHTVPDNQATTACERIGNLELHKTLPIQSKFATCIHQGATIKYWCDPNDSRFRKDTTGYKIENERIYLQTVEDSEKNATSADYSPSSTYNYTVLFPDNVLNEYTEAELMVTTYKYLYAWIKINGTVIGRVNKVDNVNKKAYITTESEVTGESIIHTIEFGCSINGYDGEISVYTPKFYIWSVDNGGANNEVWISEKKCVDYAREVKAHLIGISRCPLLRKAMNDEKWGWLNTLADNTSVSVVNYHPNLRGGSNNSSYDQYLGINNFRTQLGKAASSIPLSSLRTYTQKIKGCQILYYLIWSAIVWCYFIEYADFNVKKAFNSGLTDDGYHQGGLGNGLISVNNLNEYNGCISTPPVDYTLSAGNNTKVIINPSHAFYVKSPANTTWNNWNASRTTYTIDSSNNNIINITSISKLYTDYSLYTTAGLVGGTHKYKIEGLTENQTIVFKRQSGNLTITEDGEYEVNWGSNYGNRYITFGLVQESCNIKITILNSSAFTYTFTQQQLNVPCYRGFNTFWYGDIWLDIENFITKYDSTSKKRNFYFTDNLNNFSNNTTDKETIISVDALTGWAKDVTIGKTADLITNSVSNNSNYMNWYKYDSTDTSIHTTFVGGDAAHGSHCGLACLLCYHGVGGAGSGIGFAKCCIID